MSDVPGADASSVRAPAARHVLASAALLGGMTVLVKLASFAKDWMVARRFGASDELDAFLVAMIIPGYAVSVLAHSFGIAFMPSYIRLAHDKGQARAQRLAGNVLVGGTVTLVAITLALALAARWLLPLVGAGFDSAKLHLALALFYVLAAIIVASGISGILGGVLNAHDHFGVTSLAPIAVPVATVAVFWLGEYRYGVFALAGGTLIGFLLETVILTAVMRRRGLLPPLAWRGFDDHLRHLVNQYAPLAAGSLLMSSSAVVDQSMAASLGSGSVSILSFGSKLVALVLAIVAVSLATALLPRFSRLIAAGRWNELERTCRRYAVLILAASLPVMAVMIFAAKPMIRLVFERGAFTPETTAAASDVQRWLAPQIPFYVLVIVGFRLLSALDASRLTLWIGALNLAMNVVGNYVFMRWFGVRGIAMSTSLMYAVAAVATLAAIRLRMNEVRSKDG